MAIEAIQAQAGHRSITSTRVYLHLSVDWLADEYRRAARSHRGPGARGGGPMNALARSQPLGARRPGGGTPEVTWNQIAARAPVMVATMASYLDQLAVSARPGTVADAELALRFFAHRVTEADPSCVSVARIGRPHIEDFKSWLLAVEAGPASPWPP